MATVKDNTETRTKLADAILGVVAMTPAETERMVDAILGVQDEPEPFAIPELLGERRADQDRRVHDILMAANDHAKHLRKAESRLAQAKGLAETLRCALLSDHYCAEPFADEIAGSIVDLLGKVQSQIDRHSIRHSNLFLAYFDKGKPPTTPADLTAIAAKSQSEAEELPRSPEGIAEILAWALAMIDGFAAECSTLTDAEVATELRRHQYHVSENLAAGETEDRYTITHDWSLKGIRWFLATQRFYEALLSEDEMPAKGGGAA